MIQILAAVPAVLLPSSARVETNAIFLPSGDHAGSELEPAVRMVRGCAALPSEFIDQTFLAEITSLVPLSAREEVNASLVPFGDHTGETLEAVLAVRVVKGLALLPSAFITQMFTPAAAAFVPSRARVESNAILLPSGDQAEWMLLTSSAVSWVRGVALAPSAFITQMFAAGSATLLPSSARKDSSAIFAPLGDHTGEAEEAPVRAVSGLAPVPSEFMSHIFVAALAASLPSSAREEVNTTFPACGTTTILGEMLHPQRHSNMSSARVAR